jgi:hypothetical protein
VQQISSFSFYPNPANESLVIKTEKATHGKKVFVIYDLSGKEISRTEFFTQQLTISVAALPAGMYFCTLLDENGNAGNSKLVIAH